MNKKLNQDQIQEIYNLYFNEQLSQTAIAEKFNVSQNCIRKNMKRNGWTARTHKECAEKRKPHLALEKWRDTNIPWNKGLTKSDPRVKELCEKGAETQRKNGKSKGKNNPMWGKVTKHSSGIREDLGHYTRSSWEANFARILRYNGLLYEYETKCFLLKDGTTYTPDFYIPKKNIFYEIKGYEFTDKHIRFKKEYPDIKIRIVREKEYTRLVSYFSSKISFEDKIRTFNKDQLVNLFKLYIEATQTDNVTKFCNTNKISYKFIIKLFGSMNNFRLINREFTINIFKQELIDQSYKFKEVYNQFPTSIKQLSKFFKRAYNLSSLVFGNNCIENIIPYFK